MSADYHWLAPFPYGRAYFSIAPLRPHRMRRETNPDLDLRPMLSSRLPSRNDARLRRQSDGGRRSAPCEKNLNGCMGGVSAGSVKLTLLASPNTFDKCAVRDRFLALQRARLCKPFLSRSTAYSQSKRIYVYEPFIAVGREYAWNDYCARDIGCGGACFV